MAYEKQTWDTTSFVNPTRMNHIEDGIESAHNKIYYRDYTVTTDANGYARSGSEWRINNVINATVLSARMSCDLFHNAVDNTYYYIYVHSRGTQTPVTNTEISVRVWFCE